MGYRIFDIVALPISMPQSQLIDSPNGQVKAQFSPHNTTTNGKTDTADFNSFPDLDLAFINEQLDKTKAEIQKDVMEIYFICV